jgi:septum site-determining protein MinD
VLAVAGGKGGSGKTTTTLGLARAFAQRRRRPLVVDCDLDAPNLHLRAGVPRDPGLDADAPLEIAHASGVVPGVDVLPAGDATGDNLADALAGLPGDRPVLLDCPAGASEAAARPLRAADGAVVVATSGPEQIEDAVKTAAMARAVGTPVRAAVVSRVQSAPAGLGDALGTPHTVAVPPVDEPLADSQATAAYATVADVIRANL